MPDPPAKCLLLVEDDAAVRTMLAKNLRERRFRVIEAADAEAALRLADAEAGAVDLLVTDVMMPGLSGAGLSVRLRERWPAMRILFISGYGAVVVSDAPREGAAYLQKPFSLDNFVGKIEELLAETT
ncbi:MAG: response regulator [Acidobacteria bacterium]|nr:response regulator [Acidobacteriota bacterium]